MNTVARQDVSLDLALRLVDGVRAAADRLGVSMGVAVVDTGGHVVAAAKMDGAQLIAVQLASDKAFTAVACGCPTDRWFGSTQPGGADWGFNTTLAGRIVVIPGGLPVTLAGEVIGGLGVSGAAADVDLACATAGLIAAGLDGEHIDGHTDRLSAAPSGAA